MLSFATRLSSTIANSKAMEDLRRSGGTLCSTSAFNLDFGSLLDAAAEPFALSSDCCCDRATFSNVSVSRNLTCSDTSRRMSRLAVVNARFSPDVSNTPPMLAAPDSENVLSAILFYSCFTPRRVIAMSYRRKALLASHSRISASLTE
ncbi:hypothetical protein [Pseudomonas sp. H2_D02]